MTPYIALALVVIGMGIAIPLALHWDRQQRERHQKN